MFPTLKFIPHGIALSMLLVGCSGHPPTVSVPVSKSSASNGKSRDISNHLFDEVNAYRASKGRRPLTRHAGLDRLAGDHARYLLKHRGSFSLHGRTVSHYGFEGRSTIARERHGFYNVSENIASTNGGAANAPQVLRSLWVKSPSHEHNMRANWKSTGIGVAIADDGTVIAVQMYGTSGIQSHQQMVDKFRNF